MFIVWAAGQEPGPPDKGRAVIYSGRSAELGVVGESGGGGRAGERGPFAGRTTVLPGAPGPAAAAAACLRRDPRRGQRQASLLLALVLSFRPPPTPTHRVQREKRRGAEKGHPSGWRECARPRRQRRGPAEAAACVVLFLDSFQLRGKKTFVSRYKKRGVEWGGVGERS